MNSQDPRVMMRNLKAQKSQGSQVHAVQNISHNNNSENNNVSYDTLSSQKPNERQQQLIEKHKDIYLRKIGMIKTSKKEQQMMDLQRQIEKKYSVQLTSNQSNKNQQQQSQQRKNIKSNSNILSYNYNSNNQNVDYYQNVKKNTINQLSLPKIKKKENKVNGLLDGIQSEKKKLGNLGKNCKRNLKKNNNNYNKLSKMLDKLDFENNYMYDEFDQENKQSQKELYQHYL